MAALPPPGIFAAAPTQPNPQQDAFAAIRQAAAQVQPPTPPQHAQMSPLVHTLLSVLQGADAMNTANFLRQPGTFETDPLMKPFARPGNPGPMLGAYGLEDKAMGLLPTTGRQNTVGLAQALLNLLGILKTQQSRGWHAP